MKSGHNLRRKLLRIGCFVLVAPCILSYIVSYGSYAVNYLKWNSEGISNYTVTLHQSGLCSSSPVSVTVTNGKVTAYTELGFTQNEHMPGWYPDYWQQYAVEEQFRNALRCDISPLCSVRYNSIRGYPELVDGRGTIEIMDMVTGGITDWCITETLNLTPMP